jgi:hypothetical protein
MTGARERLLRARGRTLRRVTADRTRPLRLDALVSEAATLVPGLVPSSAEMDAERARRRRTRKA